MLKTVSTQLALASDTLPEVLAKGNTTGGTDLAVSAGDDITLADNSKVIFGAGSDLSVYSDGTTGQVTGNVSVTGVLTNVANVYDGFSQNFGNASALPYGIYVSVSGAAPNNNTSVFITCNDTSGQKFGLKSNGGLANYQANDANLSDEREKNQFGLLDSTSDCVRNWEVVKYLYKDEDQTHPHKYGVIAQQVASHCPEVITDWVKVKGADEVLWVDGDDLPEGVSVGDVKTEAVEQVDRIGVKEQQMFWMLVKSHQEVLDTITTLKARVEALESK